MLAQGLGSFALWILYGVFQARRSSAIRDSVNRIGRTTRGLLGATLLLGGVFLLFGGFLGIQAIGGFTKAGMTWYGWLLVTLLGLAFVHCQMMGMAMLASLGLESVTTATPPTSTSKEPASK